MTVGLNSTNLANPLLNGFRGTAFQNAAIWVQLHTADPSAAGTNGVSVGSSTRLQATLSAASGGSISLSSSIGPWTNGGTSETIAYISIWTAATSGSMLWNAQLTTSKAWVSGDTITLTSLGMALAPLAA